MRPLKYFLVRVPNVTQDTVTLNGEEIYIDTKWDEFKHRTMEGEVVGVPEKYDTGVEIGDTMYFHHHVILGGNHLVLQDGADQLEESAKRGQWLDPNNDVYIVYYDGGHDPLSCQAYAHKSKTTGEVKLLGEWIFLTPAEEEQELKSDTLHLLEEKHEYNQYGYIKYGSDRLEETGLVPGDKVIIRKNSDYRMEVDGETMFRVYLKHIHGKVIEAEA